MDFFTQLEGAGAGVNDPECLQVEILSSLPDGPGHFGHIPAFEFDTEPRLHGHEKVEFHTTVRRVEIDLALAQ